MKKETITISFMLICLTALGTTLEARNAQPTDTPLQTGDYNLTVSLYMDKSIRIYPTLDTATFHFKVTNTGTDTSPPCNLTLTITRFGAPPKQVHNQQLTIPAQEPNTTATFYIYYIVLSHPYYILGIFKATATLDITDNNQNDNTNSIHYYVHKTPFDIFD